MHFTSKAQDTGYDADRLKLLRAVYDWLAPFTNDQLALASAVLEVPAEYETFDEALEHTRRALGLLDPL
jgi:hypothetical protein